MKTFFAVPAWKQAPFTRYLLPFSAGIITADNLVLNNSIIVLLSIIFLLFNIVFVFISSLLYYKLRFLIGIFSQAILFFLGIVLFQFNDNRVYANWYGVHIREDPVYLARILEPPDEKEKTFKAKAEIVKLFSAGGSINSTGEVLIYFLKTDSANPPSYNELISFKKPLDEIRNAGNPGEFNYKKYAARQNLYHQVYLREEEFIRLGRGSHNPARTFLFSARQRILDILKKYFTDIRLLGIAEALLIGYKNDLDKDLMKDYSSTGIVHIIAISGLHLGLIYWMLNFLCSLVGLLKKLSLLRVVIILSFLWSFALLTGASASVLRSAVMFSFIIIGKEFFRRAPVYNSIACSAFMLLCFDPDLLWDAGFQLSYLAVIGIVWLQAPIYRSVFMPHKWLNKIWEMAAVTISAQIMAFPICIFYFHQFPNLFLPANLIEVPVSTLVLFLEILLLLVSAFEPLAILLAKLINALILFMNYVAGSLASLSFASWENIPSTVFSTILLYMLIISVSWWLLSSGSECLKYSMLCLAAWLSSFWFGDLMNANKKQFIIYNLRGNTVAEIRRGKNYIQLKKPGKEIPWNGLMEAHLYMGLDKKPSMELDSKKVKNSLIRIGSLKVLWINGNTRPLSSPDKPDLVLITGDPKINISEICSHSRPSVIIFDQTNSLWKIEKWKRECEDLILRCHSTRENGAFIIDLP